MANINAGFRSGLPSVLDAQLEEQHQVERLVPIPAISMSKVGRCGDGFWRKPGSSPGQEPEV